MRFIESTLLDEVSELKREIAACEAKLLSLPRGSIFIRKMGNSSFAYRKRKENGKVISEYLGNVDNLEVKRQIHLSQDYKLTKRDLRRLKKRLINIEKALKIFLRRW
ncbi:MAG: hypothetical protein J6N95_03795 [Bacilli bacterium]|nr:hypothetical protein [Bacilli bacterium]